MSIQAWMRSNARLFRHAGTALTYNRDIGRILLTGPFSGALCSFFHTFAPNAQIDVLEDDSTFSLAVQGGPCTEVGDLGRARYGFVASPLYLMFMPPGRLASFFLDIYDCLEEGGVFYLSFSDSVSAVVPMAGYPSWYSDEKLDLWFYPLSDMLSSLDAVGFSIKDIQIDESDVFDRVVTMILVKNLK